MGNSRSIRKHLNHRKIWIAQQFQKKQIEKEKQIVAERVKTDVEFAKDVIKAVGDNLPDDIRKSAEKTIEMKRLADKWSNVNLEPLNKETAIILESTPTSVLPAAVKLAISTSHTFPIEIVDESKYE